LSLTSSLHLYGLRNIPRLNRGFFDLFFIAMDKKEAVLGFSQNV